MEIEERFSMPVRGGLGKKMVTRKEFWKRMKLHPARVIAVVRHLESKKTVLQIARRYVAKLPPNKIVGKNWEQLMDAEVREIGRIRKIWATLPDPWKIATARIRPRGAAIKPPPVLIEKPPSPLLGRPITIAVRREIPAADLVKKRESHDADLVAVRSRCVYHWAEETACVDRQYLQKFQKRRGKNLEHDNLLATLSGVDDTAEIAVFVEGSDGQRLYTPKMKTLEISVNGGANIQAFIDVISGWVELLQKSGGLGSAAGSIPTAPVAAGAATRKGFNNQKRAVADTGNGDSDN